MKPRQNSIPVIDLFAGPGGLGEGFSSPITGSRSPFHISLSVEKDPAAHSTLRLRAFFRQFTHKNVPEDYYLHLRGAITRDELFERHSTEAIAASHEAWLATLGEIPVDELDHRVREAIGGSRTWVLIGGPPCQAYSLVGRSRRGGIREDDHRVFLYREYLRILAMHAPPVFVMENVKGLLSSKLGNEQIFPWIQADLQAPTETLARDKRVSLSRRIRPVRYHLFSLVHKPRSENFRGAPEFEPRDFVVRSEHYGIPQARHRLIILGVREDLNVAGPLPLDYVKPVPAQSVLKGLPRLRGGLSKEADSEALWLTRLRESVQNGMMRASANNGLALVVSKMRETALGLRPPRAGRGAEFIPGAVDVHYRPDWFTDSRIGGVCNHSTRGHIASDLQRYLFAACFAQVEGRSPELADFPPRLLPDHRNVQQALSGNHFADRFRVQLADRPATTVTSHISKDGHYYIHYDPTQCRSLTVREAARLQTFPDNYFFCGSRTEQYGQVGNAVPPLLAKQIAARVFNLLQRAGLAT